MNTKKSQLRNSALSTAGFFIVLALLTMLSNPLKNASWSLLFFILLLLFLISLGKLILYLHGNDFGPKARRRLVIICLFMVVALMFSSLQALNWVDGLVLLLIGFGAVFYSSRWNF